MLNGDEIRIKQVITNILSNAVKYTKEGRITFKTGVRKAEDPDSVVLLVSVVDTGLGMSIAQSFLNMMGSNIEVNSE